ncbi:MAG: M23 family metallopeptidase [Leeuwenhoekiella sp.]
MKRIPLLLFLLFSILSKAQAPLPVGDFANPLKIPLVLAGNFGELRSNHFHSGLDIKTQQHTGLEVLASASGTVSRIKIERYGYGKALYIEHPNGYTTVYGHLSKFSPEIEAYVKAKQYEKESYAIELFPKAGEITVDQGEVVAYSGNTGGSGGPHLHFEIRDKNSRPMNPMQFGIEIKDTREPVLNDLFAYPLSDSSVVNQSQFPQKLKYRKQPDGTFLSEKITAYGPVGFGVGAIDQQDGANNKNGIYRVETSFNGEKNVEIKMDKFSFAETRYINRMIDYEYFENHHDRVQKLFVERNNPLSIYKQASDKGILNLSEEGYSYVYNINIYDYKGNRTAVLIPIEVKRDTILQPKEIQKTDYFAQANSSLNFDLGNYAVYIPKGAFYDDYYLDVSEKDNVLHLDEDVIPIQNYITISCDVSQYKPEDRQQLYIGSVGYNNKIFYTGSRLDGDKLSATTRSLGDYTVDRDDMGPKIKAINIEDGKWMTKSNSIDFKITDDKSGIKSFRATVNGKFILMEYDYKTDRLEYSFDDGKVTDTENDFKLIVTDNVGNSSTFTAKFYRK